MPAGRRCKLTPAQQQAVHDRLLHGEIAADLAREFNVNRSTISRMWAKPVARQQEVAHQIVAAEVALMEMPLSQQMKVMGLADELRATVMAMARAGKLGAEITSRLALMAHNVVAAVKVDAKGMPDGEEQLTLLRTAAGLTEMSNKAAVVPIAMLTGHRDAAHRAVENPAPKDNTKMSELTPVEAARVYQEIMRGA